MQQAVLEFGTEPSSLGMAILASIAITTTPAASVRRPVKDADIEPPTTTSPADQQDRPDPKADF